MTIQPHASYFIHIYFSSSYLFKSKFTPQSNEGHHNDAIIYSKLNPKVQTLNLSIMNNLNLETIDYHLKHSKASIIAWYNRYIESKWVKYYFGP